MKTQEIEIIAEDEGRVLRIYFEDSGVVDALLLEAHNEYLKVFTFNDKSINKVTIDDVVSKGPFLTIPKF